MVSIDWRAIPCRSNCPSLGILAAYDSQHASTLALSPPGSPSSGAADVTWTFDGARWTQLTPASSPSVDVGRASMAFDAATGQVVLFGANQPGGHNTWTWEGSNWTQHPSTTPDAANTAMASMAYDPHSRKTVLFGGQGSDGGDLDTTWTWDGSTWTSAGSAPNAPTAGLAPAPRHGAAMAYDRNLNGWLLFGGMSSKPAPNFAPGALNNDTWLWDGTRWTRRDTGQGADAPPPGEYRMVTDPTGAAILLGVDRSKHWQQWVWDGTHWQRVNGGTPQQATPPLSLLVSAVYDSSRQLPLIFGPPLLAAEQQPSQQISAWQGATTPGPAPRNGWPPSSSRPSTRGDTRITRPRASQIPSNAAAPPMPPPAWTSSSPARAPGPRPKSTRLMTGRGR